MGAGHSCKKGRFELFFETCATPDNSIATGVVKKIHTESCPHNINECLLNQIGYHR